MSSLSVEIAHDGSSQDLRTVKLQKEEFKLCKARPIERNAQPIKDRFLQNLNQTQSPQKRLRFVFNTT